MNSVILSGRIANDLEVKRNENGLAILNFTLAVDRFVSRQKKTSFIDCIIVGNKAEALAEYCSKGSKIYVEGAIDVSNFKLENGNNKKSWKVIVNSAEFDIKKKQSEEVVEEPLYELPDEELPF